MINSDFSKDREYGRGARGISCVTYIGWNENLWNKRTIHHLNSHGNTRKNKCTICYMVIAYQDQKRILYRSHYDTANFILIIDITMNRLPQHKLKGNI